MQQTETRQDHSYRTHKKTNKVKMKDLFDFEFQKEMNEEERPSYRCNYLLFSVGFSVGIVLLVLNKIFNLNGGSEL